MSAPFRAGHPPVSDQLCTDHPAEGAGPATCGFLLPFGHRHWLLGSSCARWGIEPSSRSAYRPPKLVGPQRGCRVAHEQAATGQGASFIPGTVVRSRPATILRPAPAALLRPVPTAPLEQPIGGGHFHETSTRVQAIHPSPQIRLATGPKPGTRRFPPVFSSPTAPGWNKSSLGFYPGLRTPQLPAAHARAETGQRALARVLHPRPQPGLQRRLPLELMHPHAARSRRWPPTPPWSPPSRPARRPDPAT